MTYVGELGWEFYCPTEYGLKLWDTLWEAGAPEGMVAGGYKAIDTLRLEKGYRYWSGEISPDYTPYEAGLGFAVKLDKANFIGKDALVKQKAEGIKRKLCTITLSDDRTIVLGKEPIRVGDKIVGWVASGGFGYSVNKSIAYAYLTDGICKGWDEITDRMFRRTSRRGSGAGCAVGSQRLREFVSKQNLLGDRMSMFESTSHLTGR